MKDAEKTNGQFINEFVNMCNLQENISYIYGFFTDITERKKMEEELKKHREKLEELVRERTDELTKANEHLQQEVDYRKETEKALRLSEERFAKAFQASPSIMTISTLSDGRYISVNDTFLRILGQSLEEVIGRKVIESNIWVHPNERAKVEQMLKEQGLVRNYEFSFRTKAGVMRSGLLSAESIELNGEKCMLIVTHDITDLRRLEQEMTRLGRLDLIGEMAAGIAHEIRNPMTTVRGFIQILEKKEESAKHKGYYKLMIEELDRANSIITEFLSLAKNKLVNKEEKNINELLKGLLTLIEVDAINNDKNVTVEMSEVPNLLLDEKEIRQLILNLVRNGFEAMLPGGNLAIRTYTEDEEVVIAVEDQGQGIEDDVLKKMGTPFFTTKDNGTGLGLAICYSIANRHKATIRVETSPKGSTFFVRFKIKATA